MNTTATEEKLMSTADFAAAAEASKAQSQQQNQAPQPPMKAPASDDEKLAPLFEPGVASDFRARWDAVQIGFVDDPKRAVRQADELVAQVMKSLAETFSNARAKFEGDTAAEGDSASTENLRVALRRYRSFFQRLLSL